MNAAAKQTQLNFSQELGGVVLSLEIAADLMSCHATLQRKEEEASLSPFQVLQFLRNSGVTEGIDKEQVRNLCQSAAKGEDAEKVLIAAGKLPQPGPDGYIEFLVKVASGEQFYEESEDGSIDFHQTHAFVNVEPEQTIGLIHPPQLGPAGFTVDGAIIPPILGQPCRCRAGDGVILTDDGETLVAEQQGRVVQVGDEVVVSEEFIIAGDIDFSVGNVDFAGVVEVRGDVPDGFHIIGKKGIKVTGAVGASILESEGDVMVGSISGKERAKVRCRGNLIARYLNEVEVECGGHVLVRNEIRNSFIKADGCIKVEAGAIAGGHCIALHGVETASAGSPLGLETRLTAGVKFSEFEQYTDAHGMLENVTAQIKKITDALGPLIEGQGDNHSGGTMQRRIEVLTAKLAELRAEETQLLTDLGTFQACAQTQGPGTCQINVGKFLYEGTILFLCGVSCRIREERSGPLSIVANPESGGQPNFIPWKKLQLSLLYLFLQAMGQLLPMHSEFSFFC